MKKSKLAFFQSVMALILCCSMLVGTTFAWFTDSVSSGSNIIQSGRLDIEMHYSDDLTQENSWKDASTGAIFDYKNWEPGFTDLKYLKVDNTGNLAFTYQLSFALPKQSSTAEDLTMDGGSQDDNSQSEENTDNVADGGELLAASEGGEENANPGNTAEGGSPEGSASKPAVSDPLKLAEAIDVYYANVTQKFVTREEAVKSLTYVGTLSDLLKGKLYVTEGILLPEESLFSKNAELPAGVEAEKGYTTAAIMLKMREDAGNEYMNLSAGNGFCLKVVATQYSYEKDAFGNDFDTEAVSVFPAFTGTNGAGINLGGTGTVETDVEGKVTTDTTIGGATIPQGTLVNTGVNELTVSISEKASSDANLTCGENEALRALDVHIEGVSPDNTVPIQVDLGQVLNIGLNQGNVTLYHVEKGESVPMIRVATRDELDAHNEFYYDPATGNVTVAMATFSEVAVVADTENAWEGKFDYTWYDASKTELTIANADQLAALGAIVGGMAEGIERDSFSGKTVKLLADINLGDKESENNPDLIFYPIGYYNSTGSYEKTSGGSVTSGFMAFEGEFDGQGHTIANFYQNTWEMFGDYNDGYSGTPNHFRDGMGLFGKVYGGTVKNLTVENFKSDGEYTTTGVIAAYADGATFENIAIVDCNPRVYNIGNGGIVGCVGWYAKDAGLKTNFKNITVDKSNKISALWGSYDVACGGIVGQYYPTSGQSSADYPENAGIHFENCHVAAVMDVYNDVCGNYQYYAYRYAGMIIGSIRENTTNGEGKTIPKMDGITASGCTVNYGTWNDYYYCEFKKNSIASYTHDYQFSRVDKSEIIFDEEGKVTGCTHDHKSQGTEIVDGREVLIEDKTAVYLPFHQLFTGYSWGVSSIGLKDYSGIVTNLDITEDKEHNTSVEKFEKKFKNDYLYRVGNKNTVTAGTLFTEVADLSNKVVDSGVYVSVTSMYDKMDVRGTFTPSTTGNWEDGVIKFDENKTGIVKVTIQDYDYCTPTELYLEVVDAKNYPSPTTGASLDATKNDVVLLKDIGSSGFTVSNGYTFFGNGFKVTCSGKGTYLGTSGLSLGYITVKDGGILDNIQIICNKFPTSYLYASEVNEFDEELSTEGRNRYKYQLSAVALSGDGSGISNSYVFGARNNVFVGEGNVVISNTTLESGSLANIQIKSTNAYTVTLDDVTTIQKNNIKADFDESKYVLGFGVVVGDNESASNPTIKLSGDFKQYNWVSSSDKDLVSSSYAKAAIDGALKVTAYQHTIDGILKVNMGIAYLNKKEANVDDERDETAQNSVPYVLNDVTMSVSGVDITGKVCSISNGSISDTAPPKEEYKPEESANILPEIVWVDESNAAITLEKVFAGVWKYRLTADLDNITGGSYAFKFSSLNAKKYGQDLNFTVKDSSGKTINKEDSITLSSLRTDEYTVEVTDTLIFDKDGKLTGDKIIRQIPFVLSATKTSIDPPKFTNAGTATAIRLVEKKGGDWRPAYTVLTGVTVTYWSASESKVKTVDLSTLYNSGSISSNVWTYTCDDYTLTITGGQVHSDGTKITPVVSNNTLYFASTNKAFGTGTTSRNIVLTYVFTDKNASTTWNRTETVAYSSLSEYDYNSFKNNGTLTEPSSGGGCVTPDTLVTLTNGKQVRVDSLTGAEELLVWNLESGKLDSAPIMFVDSDAEAEYEIIHLYFSDGTDVKVISEHGFWDYDLNRYVYLDRYAEQYIGHTFAKQSGNKLSKVKLTDVVLETEITTAWSPVTAGHLCYFVNGMLSMPGGVGGLFNIFDVDPATMTYDYEAMAKDIETYGLYTYEEMNAIAPLTEDMFNAAGGAYLKVSIGKGNLTVEELVAMINRYSKYI